MVKRTAKNYIQLAVMTSALTSLSMAAAADPWTGFNDEHGSIAYDTSTPGDGHTNITQNGSLYIGKNPNGLDILGGQSVTIDQSSTNAMFVAKDGSGDIQPTRILGTLRTTLNGGGTGGSVMILDSNGIFFGTDSVLDTGGIIASTGELNNSRLINDNVIELSNFGPGSIDVELGADLSVADGGMAAFVAPTVSNRGFITANTGRVQLAAVDSGTTATMTTVDFYGDGLFEFAVDASNTSPLSVVNEGTIEAAGGQIHMTTAAASGIVDTVVNTSGIARVSSVSQEGGKIVLGGANTKTVNVSGTVEADGATDGGDINVNADRVLIADNAQVSADAIDNGDGGNIIFFGQQFAIMGGSASSRGGRFGGNGGFVELSANDAVGYAGLVDTSAPNGETGVFLIDPENINLGDFSAGTTASDLFWDVIFGGSLNTVRIDHQAVANTLRTTNVDLWATNEIYTSSDFDVSTARYISGPWWNPSINEEITSNDLSLSAKVIDIDHAITLGNGSLIIDDTTAGESIVGLGLLPAPVDINVETVELNAEILTRSSLGGATTLAGSNQLDGYAETVNVESNAAKINQGLQLVQAGGDLNIGAGTFVENVLIDKAINIRGAGRNNTIIDASGAATGFEVVGDIGNQNIALRRMTVRDAQQFGARVTGGDNVRRFVVRGMSFENNGYNGVAVFDDGARQTRIINTNFLNNGIADGSGGDGDILFFEHNGDVLLRNIDIQGNTAGAANYGIQFRGDLPLADSGTIVMDNVSVAGQYHVALLGLQRYDNTDLTMTDVSLGGQTDAANDSLSTAGWGGSMFINNIGSDLNLGNTAFSEHNQAYIIMGKDGGSSTTADIDATNATFLGKLGTDMSLAENYAVEDKVFHVMDEDGFGLVTWHAGNLYATQLSELINAGAIQRGVDNSDIGGNLWVESGTFAGNVDVNKTLTLSGANAGINPNTGTRGTETIIQNDISSNTDAQLRASVVEFTDGSDGATMDGFTVNGFVTRNGNLRGTVRVSEGADDITIRNNVITSDVNPTSIQTNMPNELWIEGDRAVVTQNTIMRTPEALAQSNNGNGSSNVNPAVRFGGVDGATFTDNTVDGGPVAVAKSSGDIEVSNNTVSNATDEGIWAFNAAGTLNIHMNTIDGTNTDGVAVTNSTGDVNITDNVIGSELDGVTDGIIVDNVASVEILRNSVWGNSNIGIGVSNSNGAMIAGNVVDNFLFGISVDNSSKSRVRDNIVTNSETGIYADNAADIWIYTNEINGATETGVHLMNTDGTNYLNDADIWNNTITNVGTGILVENSNFATVGAHGTNQPGPDGLGIGNVITGAEDAIIVENSDNAMVRFNTVDGTTSNNAITITETNGAVVQDNQVSGANGTGILVNGSTRTQVVGNDVSNNGIGIEVRGFAAEVLERPSQEQVALLSPSFGTTPSDDTLISGNEVNDNTEAGIKTSGNAVGSVEITNNELNANEIGFLLEGGEIDISNLLEPNTINEGTTAMRFVGGDVSLVSNTLGTTIFSDQTGNYVELVDGALFNPGTPTIIDGLAANWDGIVPLIDGIIPGVLTAAQRNAIEDRIIDFDDNTTLGQIIVGLGFDLDEEDVFALNLFSLDPANANVNVTFLGLPPVTELGAAALAALAPEAGGESDEENVEDLANIEPAAGGLDGCWASVNQSEFDGTVNFSFGGNINSAITDSECAAEDI